MGDEDDGLAQLALQAQNLGLQLVADHRVDRRERLIHEQDRRIGGQRASHPDALLLASGQLRRVALAQFGIQTHPFEQTVGGLACGPAGNSGEHRHACDVVDHPLMRHQTATLNDVPDTESQLDRIDRGHIASVDADGARGGFDHPVDHPHRRGFAAPRRPHEHGQGTGGHVQAQSVDGHGAVRVALGDVGEGDHRPAIGVSKPLSRNQPRAA